MKNLFGGGNANSLYVPMSELEQEAVARLVQSGNLEVHLVGWGIVHQPRITFGDARLRLAFRVEFDRPEVPMPVSHFDLELRTSTGQLLFKERQKTEYGGKPIQVSAGIFLDLIWDIAIQHIDPKLVKTLVPSAKGLTSRLQDKDTGAITETGNMHLSSLQKKILHHVRQGEAKVRKLDGKNH